MTFEDEVEQIRGWCLWPMASGQQGTAPELRGVPAGPPQPRVAPAPPWAPGSWGGQHLSWRAGLWHCTHMHTHTHTRPTPSSPSEWQGRVEAA